MADDRFVLTEVIDNKKLNELMNDVRTDPSEENMIALLREAAICRFIVPLSIVNGGQPSLQALSDANGKQYMAIFADTKSYEVKSETRPLTGVISSFEEVLEVCMANPNIEGFVINPGLEEVLFGRQMLSMISDMMHGGDDTAKVGEPDHYPAKLHGMLEEFLKVEPAIDRIWVRLMRVNKEGELRWLFILEGDYSEKKEYVHDTFSNFIKPYLDGLDLMCASSEDDFVKPVIEGVKPYIGREQK